MLPLWTEIYVRTQEHQKKFEQQERELKNLSPDTKIEIDPKVVVAPEKHIALIPITNLFKIPENFKITAVYSTWYQPYMYLENLNKFKYLDVTNNIQRNEGVGSVVVISAQSFKDEVAQINIRVHMICEVQLISKG